MSDKRKVIIIGAGAAGLMAAGEAAASGAETKLLEKMNRGELETSEDLSNGESVDDVDLED